MKNLLLNAVEGLMENMDNQITVMANEIRNVETLNQRINILNERRLTVINEIEKLQYLKEQLEIRFPEEIYTMDMIDNFIYKNYNRLDDMTFIVNDMKNMIEC